MKFSLWLLMELLDTIPDPFKTVFPQDIFFADNPCMFEVPFEVDEFQSWPWEIKPDGRCDRAN